jgi:hypothetical protein
MKKCLQTGEKEPSIQNGQDQKDQEHFLNQTSYDRQIDSILPSLDQRGGDHGSNQYHFDSMEGEERANLIRKNLF